MGDKVVLKFQYKRVDTDVVVDDIDKVIWMDLINEYEELARFNKNSMPKTPLYATFTYEFKMKHFEIKSDKDPMTMLERLSCKGEIFFWVGEVSKPPVCVVAARKLIALTQDKESSTS